MMVLIVVMDVLVLILGVFGKVFGWVGKIVVFVYCFSILLVVSKIFICFDCEIYWLIMFDKECDKVVRILKLFCCGFMLYFRWMVIYLS